MRFPDFLCIGAQKAGTTWLHENLRAQPEIWLPALKELHFLDHKPPSLRKRLFGRTSFHRLARENVQIALVQWRRNEAPWSEVSAAFHVAYGARDFDWYEAIFPNDPTKVCGEICPGYARLPSAAIAEVVRRNPKIKIIYLLRDPIDRAWSSVAMHFRKGADDQVDKHADSEVVQRLKSPKSFPHCTYAANVGHWLEHLPREQMYFGFFERIEQAPRQYLAEILSFLGVASDVASNEADVRVNSGRGERINADVETELARLLADEARWLHATFANVYTERWLDHVNAALARGVRT